MTQQELDDLSWTHGHELVTKLLNAKDGDIIEVGGKTMKVKRPKGQRVCNKCNGKSLYSRFRCDNCNNTGSILIY